MNSISTRLALLLGLLAATCLGACKNGADEGRGTSAASGAAAGAPKIVAAEPTFDFGKVKQGQEVAHVFKIRNQGTAPLLIHKAHGS